MATARSSTRSAPRSTAGATAIVGPSGSGKSTLLRLLNRLADPDAGTISYRDRPLAEYDPLRLRREVSLVPQLPALLEGTVGLEPAPTPPAWPARSSTRRAAWASPASTPGSPSATSRKLSVGEQQRAMLARALAQEPDVLLLDEPTSALDHAARDAIEATLAELRRELGHLAGPRQPRPRAGAAAGRPGGAAGGGPGRRLRPARGGAGVTTSIHVSLGQVAASLALVALAAAISLWRRTDLERDIVVATVRSFVQLTAIGYAIKLIFEADTIWLVLALLAVMVLFGALTARSRAKKVPGAFWPLLIALAIAGGIDAGPGRRARHLRSRRRATWSRSAAW